MKDVTVSLLQLTYFNSRFEFSQSFEMKFFYRDAKLDEVT